VKAKKSDNWFKTRFQQLIIGLPQNRY